MTLNSRLRPRRSGQYLPIIHYAGSTVTHTAVSPALHQWSTLNADGFRFSPSAGIATLDLLSRLWVVTPRRSSTHSFRSLTSFHDQGCKDLSLHTEKFHRPLISIDQYG
jgi:hypothetical protein